VNSNWAPHGPRKRQTTQPEDPLEMCEQDLNSFVIAARAIEYFGLSQRAGYVTGLLVELNAIAEARTQSR
jgi:hypothetical protein